MGYTTDFTGCFKFDKPLTARQRVYLVHFANTRRMKRDPAKVEKMEDKCRERVGLPIGEEGEYFVGGRGLMGQDRDSSIIDYNDPPKGQPGLWCKWVPDELGEYFGWSGMEKFSRYTEWLTYLIEHFFKPWGIALNGSVQWGGEERSDIGTIVIENNVMTVKEGELLPATHKDISFDD